MPKPTDRRRRLPQRHATRPVSVAVIDGLTVVHAGIRAWCAESDPPVNLIGQFLTDDAFFDHHPASAVAIDVVVLDVRNGGGPPQLGAVRRLREAGVKTVVYSHLVGDEVILNCLDLGATTYVAKPEGDGHLIAAVRAAAAGKPYVGPRMDRALANARESGRVKLSDREKAVLRGWFVAENKNVAGDQLKIASTTVRTHLQRIRFKYAAAGRPASSKMALLARALEDGLMSVDDLVGALDRR
jgi:DNA-binding NarL/FixJ family response regulator